MIMKIKMMIIKEIPINSHKCDDDHDNDDTC